MTLWAIYLNFSSYENFYRKPTVFNIILHSYGCTCDDKDAFKTTSSIYMYTGCFKIVNHNPELTSFSTHAARSSRKLWVSKPDPDRANKREMPVQLASTNRPPALTALCYLSAFFSLASNAEIGRRATEIKSTVFNHGYQEWLRRRRGSIVDDWHRRRGDVLKENQLVYNSITMYVYI